MTNDRDCKESIAGSTNGGSHCASQRTPSPTPSPRAVASARAAVVASVGNLLDAQLQTRATGLHGGAAALERQKRDVAEATAGLRRERERLAREAEGATRRIKELGNVQNWAEVLERELLVLEETVRLAGGGADHDDEDDDDDDDDMNRNRNNNSQQDGSQSSCRCSECDMAQQKGRGEEAATTQSKEQVGEELVHEDMERHQADSAWYPHGSRSAWSEASRSLVEPPEVSSLGTEHIKSSDTASPSTASPKDNDARLPFGFL
ncbi:hypothetical protein CDD82_2085 [Ophiocordyceps australis]|uniref:Biogenesis of lysosome-related organelles complex 1 subunit 1 n=1 Tax=Ophiocordyceps australis TaxID=1399860 RepID=A0A2C5ZU31_9HYPO|nr:hypothetical protein CDD82_2085 [Ophiocordyceps australis]